MTVRSKFVCSNKSVVHTGMVDGKPAVSYSFTFAPVYSPDKDSENYKYWSYTPAGKLELNSIKSDFFTVGEEYYLDLIPAKV